MKIRLRRTTETDLDFVLAARNKRLRIAALSIRHNAFDDGKIFGIGGELKREMKE